MSSRFFTAAPVLFDASKISEAKASVMPVPLRLPAKSIIQYDFISVRNYAYGITGAILAIGLAFLLFRGINYSVEFTGGTLLQVKADSNITVDKIRSGLAGAEVSDFGKPGEFVIRARTGKTDKDVNDTQAAAAVVKAGLEKAIGAGTFEITRTEAVGPKVGGELRTQAFLAIFLSFFAVLAYLARELQFPVDARLVARTVVVIESPGDVRSENAILDGEILEFQWLEDRIRHVGLSNAAI